MKSRHTHSALNGRLRAAGMAIAVSCLVALAGTAHAAPKAIVLPPETAKLKPSELPGFRIASQKCATCHSADYIAYQPPGMSLTQWTAEMAKMQHSYGAPITDTEVKQIGAYLAVAYGSAKASDAAVIEASKAPPVSTPAVSASVAGDGASSAGAGAAPTDVMALLNANTCLACHAVDHKIVGPAYHDVAAKYKGDSQASAKLEASIRNGGVGKWGPIPMPGFANLSSDQLKALVAFVLKQ